MDDEEVNSVVYESQETDRRQTEKQQHMKHQYTMLVYESIDTNKEVLSQSG